MSGALSIPRIRLLLELIEDGAETVVNVEYPREMRTLLVEIDRQAAEIESLRETLLKVLEDGHTECVAEGEVSVAGFKKCSEICSQPWQMCAPCRARAMLSQVTANHPLGDNDE